jgi:ACS family hexuronate transporter-like MFS transporter
MAGNPAWGLILDRLGTARGMLWPVSMWTLASVSHVFARGFGGFAIARGLLGFGEGATFPGSMRTSLESLPPHLRSRGVALSYSGGSLGALVAPLIVTPIAVAFGWRSAFWFTGAIGAVWIILWLAIHRLKPAPELRRVPAAQSAPLRWLDAPVLAFVALYALGSLPMGVVLNGASLYLNGALHKTQTEIGAVLWIPPLGWETGYFFWGWAVDRFMEGGSDVRALRKTFLALAVLSGSIAIVPHIASFAVTMLLLFFTMFIAAGFIIGSLAYANRQYRNCHSGLLAGLGAGAWSLVVAVAMPIVGGLFDQHLYSLAFLAVGCGPLAGFLLWWPLSRRGESSTP